MEREAYEIMAESEGTHWWFVGRRSIIQTLIRHRVRLGTGARILEVGCGTGGNLELLGSFGSVQAVELDNCARQIACERSGIDVSSGSLPDDIGHVDGPFDLIALFDVLEHLERDEDSLKSLSKMLAPNGKLMLTVPALQFLWSGHDEMHHHYRRYSRTLLTKALNSTGLNVEYVSYFNTFLLPAAMAQRLLARLSNRKPQAEAIPWKPINTILTKIFAGEREFLRRSHLPIGLSLIAICTAR